MRTKYSITSDICSCIAISTIKCRVPSVNQDMLSYSDLFFTQQKMGQTLSQMGTCGKSFHWGILLRGRPMQEKN